MDKRGGGNQGFPSKKFCLTVQKIFVGEFFTVALISGTEKNWRGGGYQDSTSKMVCLTVPKNFVGNFLLLHYFQVPKKFLDKRGGAIVKIFGRKFFVSQCRKISQGNTLVFTNFGNRKILCLRGLFHDILSIFFVSQCRKYWQVNPSVLCFRKPPVAKKFMDKRGGREYQDFPSKNFCLSVPKYFVEESFTVALISGSEKVWIGGGNYQDFPSNFFCLTVPKISVGNTLLLHYFRVAKKFGEEVGGGGIKTLRRQFIVSQCRKCSYGNPLLLQ